MNKPTTYNEKMNKVQKMLDERWEALQKKQWSKVKELNKALRKMEIVK